jgi:hypothetical protein
VCHCATVKVAVLICDPAKKLTLRHRKINKAGGGSPRFTIIKRAAEHESVALVKRRITSQLPPEQILLVR